MKINNISTFSAFHSRNYTLYFIGRSVSQFGTWMQRTAVVWVIYSLTHSAFMLGVTVFAEQFPSFIFSAFGGVAADRHNRYKIVNITQITSMIQATLLAVLIMSKHYFVWEIIALSVILGIINAYDIPARQTMINEVVSNENDLPSALSLSAAMASLAKLLGPALSGFILEKYGAGVCFLINAASFGGVMLSIAFMTIPKKSFSVNRPKKNVFKELSEGFIYLKKQSSIGIVIVMLSVTSLFVLPYDTLIPVFAKVIFKGNAQTFGYISSFIGIGAVLGTILIASLKKDAPLRKLLIFSTIIFSIGLICFAMTHHFPLAMLFAVLAGFGGVAQFTICNIIVQSESTQEMRGRAISILLTATFGMLPLGSLIVGSISQRIGAPQTLIFQGIAGILISIIFYSLLVKNKKQGDENLQRKTTP
ncbi:MFS transporter [Rhizosphaericola mali]|uniref:MFS transporter n=1 Tax=Rhizosphaericola mali TaxID=2545455 RepID=A0A5P2G1I2_9BACT|nr:MFS transporter [Rhizosphaericola mali]QES87700.1 MFS transporter [Rhizosphaericola mali]